MTVIIIITIIVITITSTAVSHSWKPSWARGCPNCQPLNPRCPATSSRGRQPPSSWTSPRWRPWWRRCKALWASWPPSRCSISCWYEVLPGKGLFSSLFWSVLCHFVTFLLLYFDLSFAILLRFFFFILICPLSFCYVSSSLFWSVLCHFVTFLLLSISARDLDNDHSSFCRCPRSW